MCLFFLWRVYREVGGCGGMVYFLREARVMFVGGVFTRQLGRTVRRGGVGRVSLMGGTTRRNIGLKGDRIDRCLDKGAAPESRVLGFLTAALKMRAR